MGKFNPNNNSNIYQELPGALSGPEFAMPAYFNNTLYYGAVGDYLKAFQFNNAKLGNSPSSETSNNFGYPGTTPSISAAGTSNGIVWAVENGSTAVLHAYDAHLSDELYNSNQATSGATSLGLVTNLSRQLLPTVRSTWARRTVSLLLTVEIACNRRSNSQNNKHLSKLAWLTTSYRANDLPVPNSDNWHLRHHQPEQ
jgi:hypothetical protein